PTASLVIPSRGGAARLPHLIDALRAQTTQDWEAIVVIDGDVDNSASVVEAARDELPIHSIVFPENRGRSAELNEGF
ncbi:glycosyltransferase, partial [Escherichia coli]|nr:glycosyltransferase [Escherichia coli]